MDNSSTTYVLRALHKLCAKRACTQSQINSLHSTRQNITTSLMSRCAHIVRKRREHALPINISGNKTYYNLSCVFIRIQIHARGAQSETSYKPNNIVFRLNAKQFSTINVSRRCVCVCTFSDSSESASVLVHARARDASAMCDSTTNLKTI